VVIRYFGGTKLGIPGLVNAYKIAAADALDRAAIVEKVVSESLYIQFDYTKINDIMRLIREYGIEIIHQDFKTDCQMRLGVRKSKKEEIKAKLIIHNIVVA
jgi:putative IMPACT (imprinted ancient) family translation regulator